MDKLPSLAVVVPCLNEEKTVLHVVDSGLQALDRFGIQGEIIVVNDGSTDRTAERVQSRIREGGRVRLLQHPAPQGIGASFWEGVGATDADCVTMMPGDNENSLEEVLTYYSLTRDVDMIVPFVYNIEVRSRWRRVVSSVYRFIINFSFGTNLNYTNGTVVYNTRILKDLKLYSKGFFFQTELLVRLIRNGYLYAEVPYFLKERQRGRTKAFSWKSFRVVALGYLKLLWDIHVVRKFGLVGAGLNAQSATTRRVHELEKTECRR